MPEIFTHLLFASWFDHRKPVRFTELAEVPVPPPAEPRSKKPQLRP